MTVNVTSATAGTHTNTTGNLTSDAGNSGTANADLTVVTTRPGFTKSFSPSTVSQGGRSTLTFTIDNSANAARVATLQLTDNLPTGMVIADPANASTDCVASSLPNTTLTATPGSTVINLAALGNNFAGFEVLPIGATCTVTVDVVATGAGSLGNISGELSATVGFSSLSSGKASAVLTSTVSAIHLKKSFTDDPIPPGGTANLQFTITNYDRSEDVTAITFTDDLDTTLSGLVAVGMPVNDVCGTGSVLSGTSQLTLSGGTLSAGAWCTFTVSLQVPLAATAGAYPNTTSAITGTVGVSGVTGNTASDTLFVSPVPLLTKSFTNDPVGAGGTVTLEFTVTNTSQTSSATDVTFADDLTTFLPTPLNVSLPPTPDPPCGAGSSLTLVSIGSFGQGLSLTGGTLDPAPGAGSSCTFSVDITIPVGFSAGSYTNSIVVF